MAECFNEIIGINSLTLILNENVRFERPIISVENEVNLYAAAENSYLINEIDNHIKWKRTVNYSANYKQNYIDEFTFIVHGIGNEIPNIIKELRNNRKGYIAIIKTTGNLNFVFQNPIFLNAENTKKINSNSWIVSIGYKLPTFDNKLVLLSQILDNQPKLITNSCSPEIIGITRIGIYINDHIRIRRPDPSKENEVDLIAHSQGSYTIQDINELPKWERTINNSENYKQSFEDRFSFVLHGINNNVPKIILDLRNNRLGYIVEIITTNGNSFVFPTPVFLDSENTKPINSHSWQVSLSYRVPTFQDKLKKLNTLLMTQSYIWLGGSNILGYGDGAIVSNK